MRFFCPHPALPGPRRGRFGLGIGKVRQKGQFAHAWTSFAPPGRFPQQANRRTRGPRRAPAGPRKNPFIPKVPGKQTVQFQAGCGCCRGLRVSRGKKIHATRICFITESGDGGPGQPSGPFSVGLPPKRGALVTDRGPSVGRRTNSIVKTEPWLVKLPG